MKQPWLDQCISLTKKNLVTPWEKGNVPQWVKKHQINQLNNTSPFVTRGKLSSIIWITRMSKSLQLENQQTDWHHHSSMLGFYIPFAEVLYVLSFIKFLSFPSKILWINISWTLLMGVVLSQNMQLPVIITLNISQEFKFYFSRSIFCVLA